MAITRITKGVIKPNENYQAGIVTATGLDVNGNADISGSLYIGGVLTYEDVTNLDSVGIITAQKGIHVGAGVSAVGVGTFGSLDIGGDIDVDGHTNLDNVSIAGVTTTGGITANGSITATRLTISSATPRIYLTDTNNNDDFQVRNENGTFEVRNDTDGYTPFSIASNNTVTVYNDLDINGDLDVDGHTNLDNVSIAGIVTATTFSGSGANLTNLDASDLASGTVPTARLGSGTASSSTFLRGDSTFAAVTSTTINNNADNRLITGSGTANTLEGEANLTYNGTKLSLTGNSASPIVEFINSSGAANEGDVLKLRASGRGGAEDDTDIFLITNNSDTRTFGVSNAGTVNITGSIKMSAGKNINSSGIVTATAFVPTTGQLSHKNLLINGAMQVDQRGDLTVSNSNASRQYGGPDRFHQYYYSSGEEARYTFKQGGFNDSPYEQGFTNVAHIDVTTADTSIHTDHAIWTSQRVEAYNASHLKYGHSDAVSVTLSFWIKSTITGIYSICYNHTNMDERYITTYTVNVANTWEKKTITIPGDTRSGKNISPSNGYGLEVKWVWMSGANRLANPNEWATQGNVYGSQGVTLANIFSSTSNNLYLTGCQLEVGSVATPFEHRSHGEELTRCQRYYQRVNGGLNGIGANSTSIRANYVPIVNFRASPTITGNGGVAFNNPGVNTPTQSSFDCGLQYTYTPNNIGMTLGFGNFTNATQQYSYIQWDSANKYINFDAEL